MKLQKIVKHEIYARVDEFACASRLSYMHYESLFSALVFSYARYAAPEWSTASYPGLPSFQDKFLDDIEGFCRILPCFSSWVSSGRPSVLHLGQQSCDLFEIIEKGVINATNPQSPGFYGIIQDYDSRIIAAALIALSLWYTRDTVWISLSPQSKAMILKWLFSVNGKKVVDNNWHLFIVLTNAVLKALGGPLDINEYVGHYNRHKQFYVGDGFYSDGPGKPIDCYNIWEVHPFLIWLDQIDPDLDRSFIRDTTGTFLENIIYFFSPSGFPIFGRSVCYRLALPTPLILAEAYGWSPVSTAQGRAALDATWRHFIKNGAIRNGVITQGYYGKNLAVLDDYSGSASANWSLMSLAAAFSVPAKGKLWCTEPGNLPVEEKNFALDMPKAGFHLVGDYQTGSICLHILRNRNEAGKNLQLIPYSKWAETLEWLFRFTGIRASRLWKKFPYRIQRLVQRPENTNAKYFRAIYSSAQPFCEKSTNKNHSADRI